MIDYEKIEEAESYGKLLVGALFVSLLIHGAMLYAAWRIRPEGFGESYYETIVPRKFRLAPSTIEPASFDQGEEEKAAEPVRPQSIEVPDDVIEMGNPIEKSPVPSKIDPAKIAVPDSVPPSDFSSSLKKVQVSVPTSSELDKVRDQLLETEPASPSRPTLKLPTGEGIDGKIGPAAEMRVGSLPGFSNIDDLLGQTGPLEKGTPPLQLPGDLLFAYNEASLRDGAIEELKKLGALIWKNPKTKFRIEGHTDAYGPLEYNFGLSTQRAEAVKSWLIENMGTNPAQISTKGLGSSKLRVPATESVEGQAQNRRVEIILEVEN